MEVGDPPVRSLILISSRLHDTWGDLPHVTSPILGPPPPCKQALIRTPVDLCGQRTLVS